jgi:hypothetical protein
MLSLKIVDSPVQIFLLQGSNPLGAYDALTSYGGGESVSFDGSSYIARGSTTGNLPTDAAFWQILALRGTSASGGDAFETVSKNLKSKDASFTYTGSQLTSISYTDGVDTIVKTFNYTGTQLTSIVLSGDTPASIDLIKTLVYTGVNLTSITYA